MTMKSKGWTSWRLPLRILLLAAAIQGITPNAHNLASSRLLRMLFETATLVESNAARGEASTTTCRVAQNESSPGGSAQPVEKHRKKTPGVLCLLARAGSQAGLRRHTGNPLRLVLVSESPRESLIKSAQCRPPRIPIDVERSTGFLHTLCRLTC
jgi:hypothetical protein